MSSSASQYGNDTAAGRGRLESTGSVISPYLPPPSPSNPAALPRLSAPFDGTITSPTSMPNVSLPGYREAMYNGALYQQTVAWREAPREDSQRLTMSGEPRQGNSNTLSHTSPLQNDRRVVLNNEQRPPLLKHEGSNSKSSASSGSTTSYFNPRTPMEPTFERPLPTMYSQKSPGSFEKQLPPLRPQSLSPQVSMLTHQSPTGMGAFRTMYWQRLTIA